MNLSREEILLILDALREKYGPGYAADHAVCRLQGKLSVLLAALPDVSSDQETPGDGEST